MKLYHYSVEEFKEGDNKLICDYKNQYEVYEPFIEALKLGRDYFKLMLLQCKYNKACAEAKDIRAFSYFEKDATEGLFEYVRLTDFNNKSVSRIYGIYYCKTKEEAISCLTADCIDAAGFKKDEVSLFEVEVDGEAYLYDQTYYNMAVEAIEARDVDLAISLARQYFAKNMSEDPIIEVLSTANNTIVKKINW